MSVALQRIGFYLAGIQQFSKKEKIYIQVSQFINQEIAEALLI